MKRRKQTSKVGRVSIISEGVKLPVKEDKIKRLVNKTLNLLKEGNSKVDIVFVTDERIRRLNRKYRKIDRATDCLAFPMREGVDKALHPELLGDIVISVDTAKRNARLYRTEAKDEIALYIIHGLLHLLGFKDVTDSQRRKMQRLEEKILRRL